ncbi:MAG: DUF6647 family protein [Paracoccaceae bacterium]
MIRAATALFAVLLPAAAAAACPDPVKADVSPRTVAQLMRWIDSNTEYDTADTPEPQIVFCATDITIALSDDTMLADPALRAAYDPATATIYMTAPWSPVDPEITSTLLHQLIHHVQIHARDWPCPQATEFEAYWLQDQWLDEQGYGTGFDWTQILVDSHCPVTSRP